MKLKLGDQVKFIDPITGVLKEGVVIGGASAVKRHFPGKYPRLENDENDDIEVYLVKQETPATEEAIHHVLEPMPMKEFL